MRDELVIKEEIDITKGTLEQLKKEKQNAQLCKLDLESKVLEINEEHKQRIDGNPLAKKRADLEKGASTFNTVAILLVIGIIILDIVMWVIGVDTRMWTTALIASGALFILSVILWICSAGRKRAAKAMAGELREFDEEIKPLITECEQYKSQIYENQTIIWKCDEKIQSVENTLEKLNTEMGFVPYAKNHVMIFVANENLSSHNYYPIRNSITIDGIDYGAASAPFKAIELSPGLHAIKVTVAITLDGVSHLYVADVIQVRVEEESLFLKYVFSSPMAPFRAEKFTDVYEFFEATKQKI